MSNWEIEWAYAHSISQFRSYTEIILNDYDGGGISSADAYWLEEASAGGADTVSEGTPSTGPDSEPEGSIPGGGIMGCAATMAGAGVWRAPKNTSMTAPNATILTRK